MPHPLRLVSGDASPLDIFHSFDEVFGKPRIERLRPMRRHHEHVLDRSRSHGYITPRGR
jgi:hypothetical protein